ncbi:hypothetical protein LNQ03_06480 [Klebsiella pneumoniae subsp. pneumoniae]|nr:hypothetical protein [Klebsiella pneumoniae subsp. pneumoniae]
MFELMMWHYLSGSVSKRPIEVFSGSQQTSATIANARACASGTTFFVRRTLRDVGDGIIEVSGYPASKAVTCWNIYTLSRGLSPRRLKTQTLTMR